LRLAFADGQSGQPAAWIGRLLVLGSRAARWSKDHSDMQLVICISVPARDFAAVLTGCGWMMATEAPELTPVEELAASLQYGTPVRIVTPQKVVVDRFYGLSVEEARLKVGFQWVLGSVRGMAEVPDFTEPRTQPLGQPGFISRMGKLDEDWVPRICRPPADLALIGTQTWLEADLSVLVGRGTELEPVSNILLPRTPGAATWSTRIYSAHRLEAELPLPRGLRAAILDGAAAASWLRAIDTQVAIVILDRGVFDESAAQDLIQYRNTRGRPLSANDDLHWTAPAGVEVLAFQVPL